MDARHLIFIDRLREAARDHGAVADLLGALEEGLLIDGTGNKEIIADDECIKWLVAALMAAKFVDLDRPTHGDADG